MKPRRMLLHIPLAVVVLAFCRLGTQAQPGSLINFAHLEHLTERIELAGDTVSIIHVYANYPTYEWVDAKESGPEGIACVDDAARAAVLYLRHYELTGIAKSKTEAKSLLAFVMKMETPDGMFYNFIFKDHSINGAGKTSFKSFGWWGARAVWAMSTGYRVLRRTDPIFAERLRIGVELTFPHIDTLLMQFGKHRNVGKYRIPQWIFYESGADVSSELLLGLTDYYRATQDRRVRLYIQRFSEALMMMQDGNMKKFPFGLHRSWETMWHMWGNGQTQALAAAGMLLRDRRMLRSAGDEARGFYGRLLIDGFLKEMDVADSSKLLLFEQIAYGVRPMVVGLLRFYDATGDRLYLKMAGLSAAWLIGNNVLNQRMYDVLSGRCYDGIRDSTSLNRNSGAESTIEALMTLVELEHYPGAMKYVFFRKAYAGSTQRYRYTVHRNADGDEVTLALDVLKPYLRLFEGEKSQRFRTQIEKQ
ncbi:MAG TPA: hypothetical protein VGR15_11295 [Bacteroidota bacterium]|nr:hypothetical protein [Bacteroidota bacterium]